MIAPTSTLSAPRRPSLPGYTLVELMIVVALVGILSSLAIPNYQAYTAKGKRTQAYQVLSAMASAQTTLLADNAQYASTFAGMNLSPSLGTIKSDGSFSSGNYNYVLSNPNGNHSYKVIATGNLDNDGFLDILVLRSNTP